MIENSRLRWFDWEGKGWKRLVSCVFRTCFREGRRTSDGWADLVGWFMSGVVSNDWDNGGCVDVLMW